MSLLHQTMQLSVELVMASDVVVRYLRVLVSCGTQDAVWGIKSAEFLLLAIKYISLIHGLFPLFFSFFLLSLQYIA